MLIPTGEDDCDDECDYDEDDEDEDECDDDEEQCDYDEVIIFNIYIYKNGCLKVLFWLNYLTDTMSTQQMQTGISFFVYFVLAHEPCFSCVSSNSNEIEIILKLCILGRR